MQPPFEPRRRRVDVDGPQAPPPDPILIAQEVGGVLLSRWVLAVILVTGLAAGTYTLWPEPVVLAEMDYLTLQNTVIRGSVESISIDGDEARGTFHGSVPAANGEVVGISEAVPDDVSGDDIYEANAFTATVPEDSKDGFLGLAERRGVDVSVD